MKPHKTESWYRQDLIKGPDNKSMKEIERDVKLREEQLNERRRKLLNE